MKKILILFSVVLSFHSIAQESKKGHETVSEFELRENIPVEFLEPTSIITRATPSANGDPVSDDSIWRSQISIIEFTQGIVLSDELQSNFESSNMLCAVKRQPFKYRNEPYLLGKGFISEKARLRISKIIPDHERAVFKIERNNFRIQEIECSRFRSMHENITVGEIENSFDRRLNFILRVRDVNLGKDPSALEKLIRRSRSRYFP